MEVAILCSNCAPWEVRRTHCKDCKFIFVVARGHGDEQAEALRVFLEPWAEQRTDALRGALWAMKLAVEAQRHLHLMIAEMEREKKKEKRRALSKLKNQGLSSSMARREAARRLNRHF